MDKTNNLQLNKPLGSEYYNIGDFNANADIIDAAVAAKAEKAELAGHAADTAMHVTAQEKAGWNGKASKDEVYTKAETDSRLTDKADKTAVYTKSEVFTKTETNNMMNEKAGQNTRGAFTPYIQHTSGAAPTYSTQSGEYVKAGNLVYFNLNVSIKSFGGLKDDESLLVKGLPYVPDTRIWMVDCTISNAQSLSISRGTKARIYADCVVPVYLNEFNNWPAVPKRMLNQDDPSICDIQINGYYSTNS